MSFVPLISVTYSNFSGKKQHVLHVAYKKLSIATKKIKIAQFCPVALFLLFVFIFNWSDPFKQRTS